eukprot:464080-Pleurochrysis_carterae.AAC.2
MKCALELARDTAMQLSPNSHFDFKRCQFASERIHFWTLDAEHAHHAGRGAGAARAARLEADPVCSSRYAASSPPQRCAH